MSSLFEYVSVDPIVVWNTHGKILRYFKLRYGFILLYDPSNGIVKQIKQLLEDGNSEIVPDKETNNRIADIEEVLSNLEKEDLLVRVPIRKDEDYVAKEPSFVKLANTFSENQNEPCLCVTSQSSLKVNFVHPQSKVVPYTHFRDYERFGKTANVLQKPEITADILKHVLKYQRFNSYALGQLSIVDHFVYQLANYDTSKERKDINENAKLSPYNKQKSLDALKKRERDAENYLKTIEDTCYELVKIYEKGASEENFEPLNLNIIFRPDCTEKKFIDSFEKYVIDSRDFFSNVKGRLNLNFFGIKPKYDLPKEEQPPPVKNRYIFTKSFLIQTDIGILSKSGGGHYESYNEWILFAKEQNSRRPREITLETIHSNFLNYGPSNVYREIINYTPLFDEIRQKNQGSHSTGEYTSNLEAM